VQLCDLDIEHGTVHVAFNYVVKAGQKVHKDTKTHQERWIALDPVSCAFIREAIEAIDAKLARVGLQLAPDAYLFSNDPMHTAPWNPDWVSHEVADLADDAGVDLNIKTLRHYTVSQLLAARFELQNAAASTNCTVTSRPHGTKVDRQACRAAARLAPTTGVDWPRVRRADQPVRGHS
jgi:hypothetical protein